MSASDLWGEFTRDPRSADHAHLRAADADREIVQRVLADAYADGRLDRLELGELPDLVSDLVPATSAVPARARVDRAGLVAHTRGRSS
ncbi:MAG: hypothetical protein ABIQ15_06170 [Nocardioides sp.]